MILWKFTKRYWRLPVVILFAVVAAILLRKWFRPRLPPMEMVTRELEAIRAGVEADKVRAELGHEQALRHVEDKYREELLALDEKDKEQADKLRNDPEALTRFIMRGKV